MQNPRSKPIGMAQNLSGEVNASNVMRAPEASPRQHVALSTRLLSWYDRHHRTLPWRISPHDQGTEPSPYRTWVSEIMLQQTGAATVAPYFHRFMESFPTVQDLAAAPMDQIMVHWQGLGYYRRARHLHQAAKIMAQHGIPQNYDAWLALPGIGAYTAAAITTIALKKPAVAVDGNIRRVFSRYFGLDGPQWIQRVWQMAAQELPDDRWGDYTQGLMDLGATICRIRQPLCQVCPLADGCQANASGAPTQWPPKISKMVKKKWFGHAYVIFSRSADHASDFIWMYMAKEGDLLSGLWRFPGSEWSDLCPEKTELSNMVHAGMIHHVFTHIDLTLNVWVADHPAAMDPVYPSWQDAGQWIPVIHMGQYPISILMKKVWKQASPYGDAP